MAFFNSAVDALQTLVVALGAGLGIWGIINLLEGYGNDNPGAKSQGIKQLMAGGGVALIGITLIPLLSGLLSTTRCCSKPGGGFRITAGAPAKEVISLDIGYDPGVVQGTAH